MPITATLSSKFYEKFGDEVTSELVALLNAVDDSYRREFRELFAAHFGQLRAEMDSLRSELRAELGALAGQLRTEMGAMESRLLVALANQRVDLREEIATQKAVLHEEMATQKAVLLGELATQRVDLHNELATQKIDLHNELAATERRVVRWVIGLWLATVPTMAAIFVALQKLGWL